MANFTVRVELHGAVHGDYDRLHAAMEAAGYRRFMVAKDDAGRQARWHLPTAEYDLTSESSDKDVANHAWNIANKVRQNPWILVTRLGSRYIISTEL